MRHFNLCKTHCFGFTFFDIKKGIPDHIKAIFFLPCHLTAALEMVDICTFSLTGSLMFSPTENRCVQLMNFIKPKLDLALGCPHSMAQLQVWPSRESLQSSFDMLSLSGHKTLGRAAAYPAFSFKYLVEININEDWLIQWDILWTWFLIHLFWGSFPCVLVNFWIALMFWQWMYRDPSTECDSFASPSQIQICSTVMFGFLSTGIPSFLATLTVECWLSMEPHWW